MYDLLARGEHAADPRYATLATHLVEILSRGVHGEQNVGLADTISTAHNLRSVFLVHGIEKTAIVTASGLDVDGVAVLDETRDIAGGNGNTLFVGLRVPQDAQGEGGTGVGAVSDGVGPV